MAVFLNINLLVFDILPKIYVVVKLDIRPVPVYPVYGPYRISGIRLLD
jgi:hypothetical protein